MHSRNRWPEAVSVFAVGVAVGAALGVLFARRAGEETRDFIADAARTGVDDAVAQGRRWARRAQQAAGHAGEQIEAATEAGERAYDEAARHV
jgi:gas vesicle protein